MVVGVELGDVGELLVNPVVGVRFRLVEEWLARGRGVKAHAYVPPTDWILDGGAADRGVVEDLVSRLTTVGMEFIAEMSNLLLTQRGWEAWLAATRT